MARRLGLVVTLLCAGLPAAAHAQITWQKPQTPLTPAGTNVSQVAVAVGANGAGAASWQVPIDGVATVQASLRAPGAYLGAGRTLNARSENATPAVAPDGTAVVAWDAEATTPRRATGGNPHVPRAVAGPPGGTFGPVQQLGANAQDEGDAFPLPVFDATGKGAVLWPGLTDGGTQTGPTFFRNVLNGMSFSGPSPISSAPAVSLDHRTQQDVATAPDGAQLLVWRFNPDKNKGSANDANFVYASYKAAGSDTFTPEVQVPGSKTGFRPRVAYAGNGEFAIAFSDNHANLYAVLRTAQGTWRGKGTATQASYITTTAPTNADTPTGAEVELAGNADGLVAMSYLNAARGPDVQLKKPGEWFSDDESPQGRDDDSITPGTTSSGTDVAVDQAGDVVVVWSQTHKDAQNIPSAAEIRAAYRPAGGAFLKTTGDLGDLVSDPASPSDRPRLGVDAAGNALVAWEAYVQDDNGDTNYRAQATVGTQPGMAPPPPPPPSPTASPTPTPVPGVATVTNIKLEMPLNPNAPVVVSAVTSGPVKELRWNEGRATAMVGKTTAGGLQTGYRFRTRDDKFSITVKAVGSGASGKPFTKQFAMPRSKSGRSLRPQTATTAAGPTYDTYTKLLAGLDRDAVKTVKAKLARAQDVAAVGGAGSLAGVASDCGIPTTVRSGDSKITGCLRAMPGIDRIPDPERGVLGPLRSSLGIGGGAKLAEAAVALSDGFKTVKSLNLSGGFPLEPAPGASIVYIPQAKTIASSKAGIRVGGDLLGQKDLRLDAENLSEPVQFPAPKLPSLPTIGGFRIADVNVSLEGGQAIITGSLKLPDILSVGGVKAQASVKLRATPTGYIVDDVQIGPIDVSLGGVGVDAFKVNYRRANDEWYGQGRACLPGGFCLSMIPPDGHVSFIGGAFNYAGATLSFGPGIPIFPGVDLRSIIFGFGLDPTRFTGGANVRALDVVGLDGRMVMAFASPSSPYRLDPDEVGNDFGRQLYDYTFTHFTMGVSAGVSLVLPVVGETKLGNGYFLYEYPGYVAFGGGFDVDLVEIIKINGGVSGELDAVKGYFNLHGDVDACVDLEVSVCAGAVAHVGRGAGNSGGAGACVNALGLSIGGGYVWKTRKAKIWPFDGCKWSIYKAVVHTRADGPMTIKAGEALQIDGAGDAPLLKVTAPDGTVTQSAANSGLTVSDDKKVRILRYAKGANTFTVVGVQAPADGAYKVEPAAGSVPTGAMSMAEDPPDAKIDAKVSGSGDVRTLKYDIAPRDNQVVTFLDEMPGGAATTIGRVTKSGKGRLDFKPAPGRGKHTITAQFELAGIPAERRTVARFTPPSQRLAKPGILRTRRTKRGLRVKWLPVSGATGYEVVATIKGGGQKLLKPRKRAVTIPLPRTASGRISVRATAALREGAAIQRRFRAVAKRKTAVRRLPHCKKRKRKIVCR